MRSRTNPHFSTLRPVIAAILGSLIAAGSASPADSTVPKTVAESLTDTEKPGTEMRRQVGYLEGGPKEFIKWAESGN